MGDNAAQGAEGQAETRQSTPDGRESLLLVKKESMSIILATTSSRNSGPTERQADVVGDKRARGGISVLSTPVDRACTRVDE